MSITVSCTQCGKLVERKPYQVKKNNNTYCSNACRSAWMSENLRGENNTCWRGGRNLTITVACVECGKDILRMKKYTIDGKNNFCSKDCEGSWKKKNQTGKNASGWRGGNVTVTCAQCGKPKEIPPSQVCENNFCDQSCRGKWASINKRGTDIYNYVEKINVGCSYCGKDKFVTPRKAEQKQNHFCDTKCMGKWQSAHRAGPNSYSHGGEDRIVRPCSYCGKPVERKYWEPKCENIFCSRECYDVWRSKKRATVSCSNCGKTFDVHAYRQGNPNYFCGRKCRGEWMSKNITGQSHWNYVERVKINCACCGVEMDRVPNKVGEYNFCSKSCANKSTSLWAPKERVTVRCSYCDKPIERHPRTVNKTNFCNHGCMGKWFSKNWVGENHPLSGEKSPAWRGGVSFEPYPVTWNNKLKGAIRNRDNHTCQVCGVSEVDSGRKLDVHHIDYDKNNLNYSNLISLCMSCHRKTNHRRDEWLLYFKSKESTFPECKEVAL